MLHYYVCAWKITSLCVQQLWFVPSWLTSRHTRAQTESTSLAYMNSSASWAKALTWEAIQRASMRGVLRWHRYALHGATFAVNALPVITLRLRALHHRASHCNAPATQASPARVVRHKILPSWNKTTHAVSACTWSNSQAINITLMLRIFSAFSSPIVLLMSISVDNYCINSTY